MQLDISDCRDIDTEFKRHVQLLRPHLYERFMPEILEEIAKDCKNKAIPYDFDPFRETQLFEQKYKDNYIQSCVTAKKLIVDFFKKFDILHRLYSIDEVIHDAYKIAFVWKIDYSHDLIFSCVFPDYDPEEPDSTFRFAELNMEGSVIKGDAFLTSKHLFSENLEDWYIRKLKNN